MENIVIDNKKRHGKPLIKGTRISVEEVLGALAGGMTYEEIEKEYGLKKTDVITAIKYAVSLISSEEVYNIEQ